MQPQPSITVQVELLDEAAWALAQLLKRLGYSDCRRLAEDDTQAWLMMQAVERLRQALARAGCAPR
jgi:hypothetical protein